MTPLHLQFIIAALVVVLSVTVVAFILIRRLQLKAVSLEREIHNTSERSHKFIIDYEKLVATVEELAHSEPLSRAQIKDLATRIDGLDVKLREIVIQDPQVKLYKRATQMAQQGISAKEIASACDLDVAEAKVLVNLHQVTG